MTLSQRVSAPILAWLTEECQPEGLPLTDFARLCEQVRPADVVLVEGRSRLSGVIQAVTISTWSHAALYLGRLDDLADKALAEQLRKRHGWRGDRQLLIETEIDRGCLITTLDRYRGYHLRICRPRNLLPEDRDEILVRALARLGSGYNMRQIIDLLRFFFPYGLLPRRWRSSLFEAGCGDLARTVCSTLVAEAFMAVRFPILPLIQRNADGEVVFMRRNARLMTPRDFDYSPYFDIVKYPFFGDDERMYREMSWQHEQPSKAAEPVA